MVAMLEPAGEAVGGLKGSRCGEGGSPGSRIVTVLAKVTQVCSINMSEIMTGMCIAKIAANDPALSIASRGTGCTKRSRVWSTISEALEDVTALFYERNIHYQ